MDFFPLFYFVLVLSARFLLAFEHIVVLPSLTEFTHCSISRHGYYVVYTE